MAELVVAVAVAALLGALLGACLLSERNRRTEATQRLAAVAARLGDPQGFVAQGVSLETAVSAIEDAALLVDERAVQVAAIRVRLASALDAVPEGVLVVDENGEEVFRNPVAAAYRRARHGDALVEGALGELLEAAGRGHAGSETLDLFGPPRRTVAVTARPLTSDNDLVGAMAMIEDMTERRRLEDIRRDFVANISHELKTPIGALSLLSETLLAEEDPEVAARLAERMVAEVARVTRTIDDLLALSRIESEDAHRREVVTIESVVAESVHRILPAAEQRDIELEVEEISPRLEVLADRRQLTSAVTNLLDNAVKYSDPSSVVQVRAGADASKVSIVVQDHGIGIPARDIERIFERFYRVDQARSRDTGGTGLGLAIVRHVAANHDGRVLVDARLGEGSTFVLELPSSSGLVPVSSTQVQKAVGS